MGLVLEKSFPLFESLLAASGGDAEVTTKICAALSTGLNSISERALSIVHSYTRILTSMLPTNAVAFSVAKPLFLIFFGVSPAHDVALQVGAARFYSRAVSTPFVYISSHCTSHCSSLCAPTGSIRIKYQIMELQFDIGHRWSLDDLRLSRFEQQIKLE